MRKSVIVVPLVAVSLVAVPIATSAGELTGNDLLPACRDFVEKQFHKDPLNQGQCIGIIQALAFAAIDQPFQRSVKSRISKRSIIIAGHKTSVSLEDEFWNSLKEIAGERGMTLGVLVAAIDANRQHTNLSSAIRLFMLGFYRDQRR